MECVLLRFRSLHLHKKYLLSTCSNPVESISFSQISLTSLLGAVLSIYLFARNAHRKPKYVVSILTQVCHMPASSRSA